MSAGRLLAAAMAACVLATSPARADDSSPGNLKLKESLAQKLVCRGPKKSRVCTVAEKRGLNVAFDAAVALDTTLVFDAATRISFRLGALTFESSLGNDPKWTRFRKVADLELRAAGTLPSAPPDGSVRVKWSSRHVYLKVKARTAALLANFAPAVGSSSLDLPVDAAIRVGDGFWFFAGGPGFGSGGASGRARVKTATVAGAPVNLVQAKVTYSGLRARPSDDAKPPKLFVDAPARDSILGTSPVVFTGRATDDRELGTLVYFVDGGPSQVAVLTIDPASGGRDDQRATFSFNVPLGLEGLHHVLLRVTDRGTNSTEVDVPFAYAVPRPTLLATGDRFSIAAREGLTFTWGTDVSGQLGNGAEPSHTTPSVVLPLSSAKAVAAGLTHCIVLLTDGTVRTSGSNANGQLGNGETTDLPAPATIPSLSGVTAIAAGNYHSMALRSDGTVWCWGSNALGQVGDGTGGTHDTGADAVQPVRVPGLSGVASIAAGADLSVAVLADGTMYGWGDGTHGRLPGSQPTPSPVAFGPLNVVEVAIGGTHVLARRSDGTVFAWGHRRYGCIGDGVASEDDQSTPKPVDGIAGAVALASSATSCAVLLADATVHTWGNNDYGQLGSGVAGGQNVTPAKVFGLGYVLRIASSAQSLSFLVHRADNAILGWGEFVTGDAITPSPRHEPTVVTLPR